MVREDAEEAYASDDKIDPVPNSAYDDAHVLLEDASSKCSLCLTLMWSEDGRAWIRMATGKRNRDNKLYGDNLAIYGAFFNDNRQVKESVHCRTLFYYRGFLQR